MNTQSMDQQPASAQPKEPTKITITRRVRRLWRSREQRPNRPAPDVVWERRLATLEARSEHLELELEGLQDAVHRRAVHEDESIDELRSRTEPNQIARDLSRNARMRGL